MAILLYTVNEKGESRMPVPPTQNHSGFSLIELMMVIGIIGMLAIMANKASTIFTVKARQIEGAVNSKHAINLVRAYNEERQSPLPTQFLINADVQTKNSCLQANPVGFTVPDCTKIRYTINSRLNPGIDPYVVAMEIFAINSCGTGSPEGLVSGQRCNSGVRDIWYGNTSSLLHFLDVTKSCQSDPVSSILGEWGSSSPFFDSNLDGVVDGLDLGAAIGLLNRCP